MKNITALVIATILLVPTISTLRASALSSSNTSDLHSKSSTQIAQNSDPELQQLDEAQKQASTTVNRIAKDITVHITSFNHGGSGVLIAKKGNTALGDKQGAISDFDKAIAINPQVALAYYNRGIAKSALGDYHGAIRDFDKAIAINPQFAEAYNNRGSAKSALGDYQGAIRDFDKAIAINPQFAMAYINRGITKSGPKQWMIADLSKAAELFRQQGQMDLYEKTMGLIAQLKWS